MTVQLADVDIDTLLDIIASSDGDLYLACERLDNILENTPRTTTEYAMQARIASFDIQTSDKLSGKFRSLLIVKLYNLLHITTDEVRNVLGDLKPADLVKTHTSLMNTFATLTAPATKVTFDFDHEVQELARELSTDDSPVSISEIRAQLKEMNVKMGK
jgi:hypothetical protein